jgi:hypothetical protein
VVPVGPLSGVIVNVDQSVSLADNSAANAVQNVASAVYAALQQAAGLSGSGLASVTNDIEGQIQSLTGALDQGISQAYDSIGSVVQGIETSIGQTLGGIGNIVGQDLFNSINPALIALTSIAATIARQIGGLGGAIAAAIAQIIPQIIAAIQNPVGALAGVLQQIEQVLTGQIAGITTQVGTIASTLGGLGTTLDTVLLHFEQWNQGFVEAQTGYPGDGTLHKDLNALWQALAGLVTAFPGKATLKTSDFISTKCGAVDIETLKEYAPSFGDEGNSFFGDMIRFLWGWALSIIKVIPMALKYWEEVKIDADQSCPNDRLPPAAIVDAMLRGFLTETQGIAEAEQGNLNRDRLKVLTDLASHQFSPLELVEAFYRKIITQSDYQSALASQGFQAGQMDTLTALGVNRLPLDELWTLRRRQLIDDPTLKTALAALQYDTTQQNALAQLTFRPINVSEAIDSAASQAAISQIGLGALASASTVPEYVSVAGQNEGLDAETTAGRWASHWNVGSIGSYITLYFRKQISLETLTAVMGKNFIPQELVTTLVEAARPIVQYRTISNMLRIGQIDVQTAGNLLLQHGYTPENAQLLINYAQRPGASAAAQKAKQLHAVSLGIAKREFIDGAITENDYYQILLEHGYTIEGANAEIAVELANQAMLTRKQNAQLVIDEYGAGLIDEQTALAQLAVLGLTVYELAKYTHKLRVFKVKSAKHPTEAELNDFRKVGIIDDKTYTAQLSLLGYSQQVAGWFTAWRTTSTTAAASTSVTPPPSPVGG